MPRRPRESARTRLLFAVAAASALALAAGTAQATTIIDPTGDFLHTYTGPQTGGYDVLSVSAVQNGVGVTISATMAGPPAMDAVYVLGINRGAGQAFLDMGSNPVGAGVLFDSVAVLFPGGGSFVDQLDTNTTAPLPKVSFSGDSFTALIPFADLPSLGFKTGNYLYNLWPRDGLTTTDNGQISDFAPNATSFPASVPEPAAWAMMLTGLAMLGAGLRSRRKLAEA